MNKILLILLIVILAIGILIIALYINPQNAPAEPETKVTHKPVVIPQQNFPSCIEGGTRLPENLQIPCCSGLSEIVSQNVDQYGGCPAEKFPTGELFCTACGNGECSLRETPCSCPEDCVASAEELLQTLNSTNSTSSISQSFSTYYPEKYAQYSSSGEGLIVWLRANDPAILRDLLASIDNPTGIEQYLKRWEVFTSVSESYAQQILQSAIGEELSNITIMDSGSTWEGCASYGPEGNITRTCCQIPKQYGQGSQLSCS
jgi:hypothetical protein